MHWCYTGDKPLSEPKFYSLRPRQNGRHFADDIFKYIFLNENVWIPIKISLNFLPKGRINNIPVLVQIMAWRRPGDKPLSGPMMVRLPTHICVTRPQWVNYILGWHFNQTRNSPQNISIEWWCKSMRRRLLNWGYWGYVLFRRLMQVNVKSNMHLHVSERIIGDHYLKFKSWVSVVPYVCSDTVYWSLTQCNWLLIHNGWFRLDSNRPVLGNCRLPLMFVARTNPDISIFAYNRAPVGRLFWDSILSCVATIKCICSLQWHHNGCDGVSNH